MLMTKKPDSFRERRAIRKGLAWRQLPDGHQRGAGTETKGTSKMKVQAYGCYKTKTIQKFILCKSAVLVERGGTAPDRLLSQAGAQEKARGGPYSLAPSCEPTFSPLGICSSSMTRGSCGRNNLWCLCQRVRRTAAARQHPRGTPPEKRAGTGPTLGSILNSRNRNERRDAGAS